ncbi:MAG: polysaccharide export outer membrane protein, partial [Flavobacteriales bacterium]
MEALAKKLYILIATSNLSVLTSVIMIILILFGCAQQQHSLEVIENQSGEFYGERNKNGYLFTQQSVTQNVFSATLNCDGRQDFAAPLNYRVDKPILSSAPTQAPLPM